MAVVGDLVVGRQMRGRLPVSGSFSLPAFMASQADGFWYDFATSVGLFQTTDESAPVTAVGQPIGRVNDRRTGPNSPRNADQATAGSRPAFQTTGAAFDGTADNLLTGYVAGAEANFIVAKVTVPVSIASTQVISGAVGGGNTNRVFLSINTSGVLSAGVGNQNNSVIFGNRDLRGKTVVVGLSMDGTTVRLFDGSDPIYSAAQSGVVNTVLGFGVGAANSNGSVNSFFGGSIISIVAGREFIDLARFNQIASQL